MKERKAYVKPAVIFEKDLEALASACGGTGTTPNTYNGGGETSFCKTLAGCTGTIDS